MSEAKLCYSIGEHGVLNDLQDDVHSEFLPRLCGLQQGGLHTGNQDWVVWEIGQKLLSQTLLALWLWCLLFYLDKFFCGDTVPCDSFLVAAPW